MAEGLMDGVQPLADRILLRADKADLERPSGLVMVEQAVPDPLTGEVVAVGEDVRELRPGDRVVYTKFGAAAEISVDGEGVLVLREADVLVRFA